MSLHKVRLTCKRTDAKGSLAFAKELNSYIEQGYKILESDQRGETPSFSGLVVVVMVKALPEGVLPDEVEQNRSQTAAVNVVAQSPKELLESLTKKADLLAFAEKYNIEIPEEVKQPTQISKFLKEAFSSAE